MTMQFILCRNFRLNELTAVRSNKKFPGFNGSEVSIPCPRQSTSLCSEANTFTLYHFRALINTNQQPTTTFFRGLFPSRFPKQYFVSIYLIHAYYVPCPTSSLRLYYPHTVRWTIQVTKKEANSTTGTSRYLNGTELMMLVSFTSFIFHSFPITHVNV